MNSQHLQVFLGLQTPFVSKKPPPDAIIFCIHVNHDREY